MPMWRCPHCGTPQAETARCWVCRRSSTACGTCRHFRRSVAAQLGYCGLDRRRQPLVGDEIRACWEAGTPGADPGTIVQLTVPPPGPEREGAPHREFVEVDGRGTATGAASTPVPPDVEIVTVPPPLRAPTAAEPGWSLWAELEG